MVVALAVLVVLGTIFASVLSGRGHAFRPTLAETRVRRTSGGNLGSVLAVVGIASLVLEAATSWPLSRIPGVAPLIVGVVVTLILGVVVARSATELLTAGLGVGLLILTIGLGGAVQLAIVVALLLWLLGLIRGFFA